MSDPQGAPADGGPVRPRAWRSPPWVRVGVVGALAGLASTVVAGRVLELLFRRSATELDEPFLAVLVIGPFVVAVVVASVLAVSVAAWLALRLLRVRRALLVAGVSGAVLAGAAVLLVYNGPGDLVPRWFALVSAVAHVVVWLGVRPRRP